ncbi:hypothetical protein N9Q18_00960 [bacterium]|nr:hypothetical protein [bacterium]
MSGQNGVLADLLLTPSKIAAWLDCAHYLTLKHEVEAGNREASSSPFGEIDGGTDDPEYTVTSVAVLEAEGQFWINKDRGEVCGSGPDDSQVPASLWAEGRVGN